MQRNLLSGAGLILAAILFVALNVLAERWLAGARIDLTQARLYTLSQGTRNVLNAIPEPITLKLYFSKKVANDLPQVMGYAQRVREMLQEFRRLSNGRLRLVEIDPEPFTEAEDEAVRAGLQGVPLGAGDQLYFGLVGTNMLDDQQVVGFFQQEKEQFLEYDLARLVHVLSDPKKPVVGLITGHQMNAEVSPMMQVGGGNPPWPIVTQIRGAFDLKFIDPGSAELPAGVDVLLIVHPPALSPRLQYAIDQYVLGGGKALVYVDPFSEVAMAFGQQRGAMGMGGARGQTESDLPELLKAWGVKLEANRIVGDWQAAQEVNAGGPGPGGMKILRYLPWLELGPNNINRDDVVTANIGNINAATAGSLVRLEGAATEVVPLLTTGSQAALFDADLVRFAPNPERLIRDFKATGVSYVLAARLRGKVKSAFPDGPPKAEEKAAPAAAPPPTEAGKDGQPRPADKPHLAESANPINIIVVADSDLLFEQFWARTQELFGQRMIVPTAANADMLINALDNLAGSNDLISLRSRGKSTRPFLVVDGLRREAEQRFQEQERELNGKLESLQKRLQELQGRASAGGGALLSAQQAQEIAKAREEILRTRKELRDVQHNLNRDIETLETRLRAANLAAIPLLVALFAIGLAGYRQLRRRRHFETARA
ncbi:MAG: ABC transporter [Alphaproteobacteria bacterium]|nr:ABC transporter [Alphaproteobacteria bacterium]